MSPGGERPALEALDLTVTYRDSAGEVVEALAGVSARFRPGSVTAVVGPSGSGKTTLLHCLAGIVVPNRGQVRCGGTLVSTLGERARDEWRRRHCGLIFQDFRLIDELDPLGNVLLPAQFGQFRVPAAVAARARRLLEDFGVPRRSGPAGRLSRGERQRVAMARALLLDPAVIVADEPTASLDRDNAALVVATLERLAAEEGRVVICATHDERVVARAAETLALHGGRVAPAARAGALAGAAP